jgi:hypothetical protein
MILIFHFSFCSLIEGHQKQPLQNHQLSLKERERSGKWLSVWELENLGGFRDVHNGAPRYTDLGFEKEFGPCHEKGRFLECVLYYFTCTTILFPWPCQSTWDPSRCLTFGKVVSWTHGLINTGHNPNRYQELFGNISISAYLTERTRGRKLKVFESKGWMLCPLYSLPYDVGSEPKW